MQCMQCAGRWTLLACLALVAPVRGEFKLTDSDRVVLFGDTSVSEIGTLTSFNQFVRTRYPDCKALVCNLGEPRGSAAGGIERFEREVLPLEPTEVMLCFGLEGAARKAFSEAQLSQHLDALRTLIDALRSRQIRVALITPSPPDERQNRGLASISYGDVVRQYAEAIRKLGEEVKAPVIDWHAAVEERMKNFTGKGRPQVTEHGLKPSWYSLNVLCDLLLTHWDAEPLDYEITADWASDAANATIGEARVVERDEHHLSLTLTGVPVVVNMLGAGDMDPQYWPLTKWFRYRLKVEHLPSGGYVLSESGANAKPFLGEQLAEGTDVATVGPLANSAATMALHEAILREGNQFTQYRIATTRKAPEPELEEAFRLLRAGETALAIGAHRIACRVPSRFDMTLRIETALSAARNNTGQDKPKAEKPPAPRPRRAPKTPK